LSVNGRTSWRLTLLEHWDDQIGPGTRDFHEGNHPIIFSQVGLIGPQVGNVDNLLGVGDTVEWEARIVTQIDDGIAPPRIDMTLLLAVDRHGPKDRSLAQKQVAESGLTDTDCIGQHCIEDRL
jgi:hypothetical protein